MAESTSAEFLRVEDASLAWDQLSRRVDDLLAAWEAHEHPPKLTDFLPDGPSAMRRLVLVELVKVDLEYRWEQRRAPRKLEDYLAEIPDLGPPDKIPCDLIYEEYHVRRQHGDDVAPEEYFSRFPHHEQELRRLLGLDESGSETTMCWGRSAVDVEAGDKIDDFDLLILLGQGSFAKVFLARQVSMQRLVALKISNDRGTEPQTLAQLDHPYIVRVFDQRTLPDKALRLLYMEFVSGGTLQPVVARVRDLGHKPETGRILLDVVDESLQRFGQTASLDSLARQALRRASWDETVCRIGAQLAWALEYAHCRGVLHRDVKPANVLLSPDGSPKLADFNVSFSSQLEGASAAAFFGGSLAYMSPEQLEAGNPLHERSPDSLDGRSDIFSLGVVLWELLSGKRPYQDEIVHDNWPETLARMAKLRHTGVSSEATAALGDSDVARAVVKCLSSDPADRPQTAAELARELQLCLHPRAMKLLRPSPGGWYYRLGRYPIATLITAGVLPNAVLSVLNILYNLVEIVDRFENVELRDLFLSRQLAVINSLAYGSGIFILMTVAWPVVRCMMRLSRDKPLADDELLCGQLRCFVVGDWLAWVCLLDWTLSGIGFSLWLRNSAGGGIPFRECLHLVGSHFLTGMIAAALAFFAVNGAIIRIALPRLIRKLSDAEQISRPLAALGRRIPRFVLLAVAVPPLTLVAMAFVTPGDVKWLVILGLTGLAVSMLTLWQSRLFQRDISALVRAFRAANVPEGWSPVRGESEFTL